jgi:hypothetical protein
MTEYKPNLLSIAILDYQRPAEAVRLFESLAQHLHVGADVVYCHDGPAPQYALDLFAAGKIDTMIQTRANRGCGIQTRQLFQACMTPYVLYCQVDQWLLCPFVPQVLNACIDLLSHPETFYIDLAGNQGHGRPSERALMMKRDAYLNIPGMSQTIGGPGPYSDHEWTEKRLQDHMLASNLRFATLTPTFFGDNGKWSVRAYACGGVTRHATDTKELFIEKPLKWRYDFPNLKLSDAEWQEVLEGKWPAEGKIPEADKASSFKAW